jgi:hypothetical protein
MDTRTPCAAPGAAWNRANCDAVVGALTDVGSYSASPSGTFDQGGTAFEWTELVSGPRLGARGGRWIKDEGASAALRPAIRADLRGALAS